MAQRLSESIKTLYQNGLPNYDNSIEGKTLESILAQLQQAFRSSEDPLKFYRDLTQEIKKINLKDTVENAILKEWLVFILTEKPQLVTALEHADFKLFGSGERERLAPQANSMLEIDYIKRSYLSQTEKIKFFVNSLILNLIQTNPSLFFEEINKHDNQNVKQKIIKDILEKDPEKIKDLPESMLSHVDLMRQILDPLPTDKLSYILTQKPKLTSSVSPDPLARCLKYNPNLIKNIPSETLPRIFHTEVLPIDFFKNKDVLIDLMTKLPEYLKMLVRKNELSLVEISHALDEIEDLSVRMSWVSKILLEGKNANEQRQIMTFFPQLETNFLSQANDEELKDHIKAVPSYLAKLPEDKLKDSEFMSSILDDQVLEKIKESGLKFYDDDLLVRLILKHPTLVEGVPQDKFKNSEFLEKIADAPAEVWNHIFEKSLCSFQELKYELKNKRAVAEAAVKNSEENFEHIGDDLKDDFDFLASIGYEEGWMRYFLKCFINMNSLFWFTKVSQHEPPEQSSRLKL